MKQGKMEIRTFYCIQCGQAGLPLPRHIGTQHEKFHRKKLWCPNCKVSINHIECRNDVEVYEFKGLFESGEFKNEIEESLKESSKELI